jgi:hypothetical protein
VPSSTAVSASHPAPGVIACPASRIPQRRVQISHPSSNAPALQKAIDFCAVRRTLHQARSYPISPLSSRRPGSLSARLHPADLPSYPAIRNDDTKGQPAPTARAAAQLVGQLEPRVAVRTKVRPLCPRPAFAQTLTASLQVLLSRSRTESY